VTVRVLRAPGWRRQSTEETTKRAETRLTLWPAQTLAAVGGSTWVAQVQGGVRHSGWSGTTPHGS
jgi:hypothetical protein